MPRKPSAHLRNAAVWQTFYKTDGRAALGALFAEFGLYSVMPPGCAATDVMRREGQRDVLLRIVQMIGLKEEAAPADAWEDVDILERMRTPNA